MVELSDGRIVCYEKIIKVFDRSLQPVVKNGKLVSVIFEKLCFFSLCARSRNSFDTGPSSKLGCEINKLIKFRERRKMRFVNPPVSILSFVVSIRACSCLASTFSYFVSKYVNN